MKHLFIVIVMMSAYALNGQEVSTDSLRKRGYEAMTEGKIKEAIRQYSAILAVDSADYDARLALGKLHYRNNTCDSSVYYYQTIYNNDSTDAEAMMGFSRCFIRQGKLDKAIYFSRKTVKQLPEHIPAYLLLAKALSYDGRLDEAIDVYLRANKHDSTWSEVWAGLGKMYYWKAMPATAEKYYQKALLLDPENTAITDEYEEIEKALSFKLTSKDQYVQEEEESYKIDAYIRRYGAQKRLTDKLQLSVNVLLDYSSRDFTTASDTTRWFDNTWVKASWITEKNNFSAYAGASNSDQQLTTYGLSWSHKNKLGRVKLENSLDAGYNYFYYWNEVGRTAVTNKFKLTYASLMLDVDFGHGYVDEKEVRKYYSDPMKLDINPYLNYRVALTWKVTDKPVVKVGANHSYFDYKYISREYYTPNDRLLTGPMLSVYYDYNNFYFYVMYSYNFGTEKYYYLETVNSGNSPRQVEKSGTIEADNWSASAEAGYNHKNVSLAAGAGRFYNPYYQNLSVFVSLSARF